MFDQSHYSSARTLRFACAQAIAPPQYNSGRLSAKIGILARVASTVSKSIRTVSSASVSPPSISVSPHGSITADEPKKVTPSVVPHAVARGY